MLPEIHLSSSVSLSTYFLIISLACVIGSLWFIHRAEKRQLFKVVAIDLTMTALIAGLLGARLLHVLYEDPTYYARHPWAVLQIWNGGFVFFGGVAGAWISALLFCQIRKEPFWFWADTAAPPIALAYGLGRLACFANGCCFGKECQLPWAIFLHGAHRHPTQLYATFSELALVGVLLLLEPRLKTSGVLFNIWLIGHAAGRVLMEAFRADPRGDLIAGMSLGTLISLCLAAYGLYNLAGVWLARRHALSQKAV